MKTCFYLLILAVVARAVPLTTRFDESKPHEDDPQLPLTTTETPEESFIRSDADGDAKLSFDEFLHTDLSYVQLKKAEFESIDKDGDDIISATEYAAFYQKDKADSDESQNKYFVELFKEFDTNSDKRLTPSEVRKILSKRFLLQPKENFGQLFSKFDDDKDGGLNLNEYKKFDQTFPFYELEPIRVVV
uniref:EF-hand domain-containing protein n=1 Tax=Panagrolaimus sp. JU765 TaxID=591449 RepID=A0AC34R3U9_9BILA